MELFHDNGHLTDEGLTALVENRLDELGRLEAAEHLSFCDACLEKYTDLLSDESLMAPEKPMQKPVLKRIRQRGGRVMWARYGTVAAAACLAVAMWGAGTMLPLLNRDNAGTNQTPAENSPPPAAAGQPEEEKRWPSLGQLMGGALDSVGGSLNTFLDSLEPASSGAVQSGEEPASTPAPEAKDDDAGTPKTEEPKTETPKTETPAEEKPLGTYQEVQQQTEQRRKEKEKVFDRMKEGENTRKTPQPDAQPDDDKTGQSK